MNNNEDAKIVLYQKWDGRKVNKHGIIDKGEPTKMLYVFPATPEGIEEAVTKAERPDAVLVRLNKDYDSSVKLIKSVEDKIRAGKGVTLFKPANRMPRT